MQKSSDSNYFYMYTYYPPNLFNGFLLKSARNNCCASGERNCGIPNLALKKKITHIYVKVHHVNTLNIMLMKVTIQRWQGISHIFFSFPQENTIIKSIFWAIKYERRELHVLQNKSE